MAASDRPSPPPPPMGSTPAPVISLAMRKLRRKRIPEDPEIGAPRTIGGVEIKPGYWMPDYWGLPPDCPVVPLGVDGDYLILRDVIGQLRMVLPTALGMKYIQSLFGYRQRFLYWAWPRHDAKGKIASWRAEKVAEGLYHSGVLRGSFSVVDRVRGRGAWRDTSGALIYHSGGSIWRTASGRIEEAETGDVEGFFYERRPDILEPWPDALVAADNPCAEIVRALRRWNWGRPLVDPVLFLGWLAAALLSGALPWRPTVFVVGDKSVGKSTLQGLAKAVLGDALVQSADTTAAGIYQRIKQDSLAVAVDELESERQGGKAEAVIRLARLSASGAMMFRGGQDHNGTEFRAMSCFFFSSINPPALMPQDVSRMAVLRLDRLAPEKDAEDPPALNSQTCGSMLLRRLMDNFGRFERAYRAYRQALADGGHDGRGQDTFGTLLACADLALGPELADELGIPMIDDLSPWSEWLSTASMLEYEALNENWANCLKHLLTSRVDAWRGGQRHTVGQLLDDLAADFELAAKDRDAHSLTVREARRLLAQAGLGVLAPGELKGEPAAGWVLAVPNESQLVADLFKGTIWAGLPGASVWKSALRQGPARVIGADKGQNRVRLNGVQERCTLVQLKAFDEMMGA